MIGTMAAESNHGGTSNIKTEFMIGFIILAIALLASLCWLWAGGIDYMKENHPEYKGEDFLSWTEEEKKDIQ